MPRIPLSQHQKDIADYKGEYANYKLYADVLRNILQKASDLHARDGIVQARPKSIESFSEKIIRKDKYLNPLMDMTDLCGARVIVHFASQVQAVCEFIRNNFEVDEANSVDVKTRLRMTEFGYRSVHYVVIPRSAEILGISIPESIRNKKAEIQVRTFNEHVWADILHDRIYKTKLRVPSDWQRESGRLAAVLEEVDNSFKTISETLDQFSVNYRPTPGRKELENEIFILKTLINVNKEITDKSVIQYLKLAMLYNLLGEWDLIRDLLDPVYKKLDSLKNMVTRERVKLEYGFALGKIYQENPMDTGFEQGLAMIRDVLIKFEGNSNFYLDISKANYYLAILCNERHDAPTIISDYLMQAVKFSPNNPYYLIRSIIEEISLGKDPERSVHLFAPQLKKIIDTCKEHIEIGIEIPLAYIARGMCYLLLEEENKCALQFIELLMLLQQNTVFVSEDTIQQALGIAGKIKNAKSNIVKGLLQMIAWKQFGDPEAEKHLRAMKSKNIQISENVLIIAGLSLTNNPHDLNNYSSYIHEALFEYSGEVIIGGVDCRMPEMVGTYNKRVNSGSKKFTFAEVLIYWVDILFNEFPVQSVMLLGINGDELSETEYKMATALGVKTALMLDSGGAADNMLHSSIWCNCANLLAVPQDPQTIWALVMHYRQSVIDTAALQSLVELVHDEYRKKRLSIFNPETNDINKLKEVMEWQYLDPNLKASNLKQLEFMEHLLRRVGLKIRKSDSPGAFLIPEDLKNKVDFDSLARLEHARWNAERLLDGWKYGPVKDVGNKTSPYLISWDKLDEDIKTFDYDPVKKFPEFLAKMGYEIYYQ